MGRIAKLSFDTAFTELQRISSALAVSAHEALGLMTAVVSAPELIRPSDWPSAGCRARIHRHVKPLSPRYVGGGIAGRLMASDDALPAVAKG